MSVSLTKTQRLAAGIALVVVCACFIGASSGRDSPTADDDVKLIRTEKLANVPGQTLTMVTFNYPPRGKSRRHHHAGSVYAYVLAGAVRSENSATGPVKVYKAGESFFGTARQHAPHQRECKRHEAGQPTGRVHRRRRSATDHVRPRRGCAPCRQELGTWISTM
jgi:quercetin dioxygenase-like cupin family protein